MRNADLPAPCALDAEAPGAAPWVRSVFYDWYDGPLDGAVEVAPGGAFFVYHMVAIDAKLDERVFLLRRVPREVVEEIFALDAALPPNHDPARQTEYDRIAALLQSPGEPAYVVSSRFIDDGLMHVVALRDDALKARVAALLATEWETEDERRVLDGEWLALAHGEPGTPLPAEMAARPPRPANYSRLW